MASFLTKSPNIAVHKPILQSQRDHITSSSNRTNFYNRVGVWNFKWYLLFNEEFEPARLESSCHAVHMLQKKSFIQRLQSDKRCYGSTGKNRS
eukprot:m.235742 g.235742  ORF g.235742 m.235742 type:complete len:93 (-) comp16046_c0_seq27:342-620(-)